MEVIVNSTQSERVAQYRRQGIAQLVKAFIEIGGLMLVFLGSAFALMFLAESAGYPNFGGVLFFVWFFIVGGAVLRSYSRRVSGYWYRFGYARSMMRDAEELVEADMAYERIKDSGEPVLLLLRTWGDRFATTQDAPISHPGLELDQYDRDAVATNLPALLGDKLLAAAGEALGDLPRFAILEPGATPGKSGAHQVCGFGRQWELMVDELIKQARFILVLIVDEISQYVRWELERVLESGRAGNTLIVLVSPCKHFKLRRPMTDAYVHRKFPWVLHSDADISHSQLVRSPPELRAIARRLREALACRDGIPQ